MIKIISLAVACLFIYSDIAFAVAPKLALTQPEFEDEYITRSFILTDKSVSAYISSNLNPKLSWIDGEFRIKGVKGLLKNTGQVAKIDSDSVTRKPIIYIDTNYFYNETIIGFEKEKISELIKLWELKKNKYGNMSAWVLDYINKPDPDIGMTSRQKADEINKIAHEKHPGIDRLYERIKSKYKKAKDRGQRDRAESLLNFASMYAFYKASGSLLDRDDKDGVNIAAHQLATDDDPLNSLIHDEAFINLFKDSLSNNKGVSKEKLTGFFKGIISKDGFDINVVKYDEAVLLVVYKHKKPYRIIRYAANSYVDYLSAPRLNPDERHSANVLDNGHKFEIFRDRPEVLGGYLDDIEMYYENPVLRPIVDHIWTGEYYNLREAIDHLKRVIDEFSNSTDDSGKKIKEYALRLFHTLTYHENKGIRVEATRALHDIYTGRPAFFPPTRSFKTVLHRQDQKIRVSCRKGESAARIQWVVNGKIQPPIDMLRPKGAKVFSAIIPVTTGTIHYVVEVNMAGKWIYKVGGTREEQVSGVIKTQKDARGKHTLEVRTAIFDLPDGGPMWNEDGSLVISNFDQLRKLLPELKKHYDDIWLMDCFEWGPVCWPGKDPSSFAPLDHISVAKSLGGKEALDRLKAEADAGEKKMPIFLSIIPHISQSNTELPVYFPIYHYDGLSLVRHNSSDGTAEWDDSFQPNWRRKEVMDWYVSLVRERAKEGYSFRGDITHAFDTSFKVESGTSGLARIFGDIVTNDRRNNGFETTDLSGTAEPNVILSMLAYEIQANAPNSLIYGENFATFTEDRGWQANDIRLIKSGVVPYNSLHEEIAHVLRDHKDVSGIIDHMLYRDAIHKKFGGQDVTIYSTHDYQRDPQIPDGIYRDRPPLQLYGDGIMPFMATIFLLSHNGPVLWHFARLLGDKNDDFNKRHNLSLAEFWKIWVNNIREFDYDGAVKASLDYLKDNPDLAKLGDYVTALKKIPEEYDVMKSADAKLVRHDSDCMSVLKQKGDEVILGFINYGYHNRDVFRPLPELNYVKDDQIYELKELFRYRKGKGVSSGSSEYLRGSELKNLGIHKNLSAWETMIYSIKPVKVDSYTIGVLSRSMAEYKKFGVEDRVKYSLVSSLIRDSISNNDYIGFKDILVKMIQIAKRVRTLEMGDVATVLHDISRSYPEYKDKMVENLTRIALEDTSDTDMDVRYEAVKILRGMSIGEVAIASVETRDIAGLGGLALYIKDLTIALVDLGIDTTLFTAVFDRNREGKRIFETVLRNANLSYTGRNIAIPFYGENYDTANTTYIYETMLGGKVRTYALHNDKYCDVLYGGITGEDLLRRYRFFGLGTLEAIRSMNIHPAVIQTNEGSTGFALPYLSLPEYDYLAKDPHFKRFKNGVHANHNLDTKYQNRVMADDDGNKKHLMSIAGFNSESFDRHMLLSANAKSLEINPTYAANSAADCSVTVSPGYRDYTADNSNQLGLGDMMSAKLSKGLYFGEQNGIDTVSWQKKIFRGQTPFECKDGEDRSELFQRVKGNIKPAAKNELQRMIGLDENRDACLFTMLHRLCEQKGYEIAIDSIRELLNNNADAQVAIGGPAEDSDQGRWFKRQIEDMQADPRYRGRFKYVGGVNPNTRLYELMYLGADVFLMPSKFEPAGLSQSEALAAGAVAVVRDVDGLSTSITDPDEAVKKGVPANGFKFFDFNSNEFRRAMMRAFNVYRKRNTVTAGKSMSDWDQLSYNAFTYDSRWIGPAKHYINDIYAKDSGVSVGQVADFPELLLIFSEAEKYKDEWGKPDSKESLEKRLIEHGYNTNRGLDYVLEDAVKELGKIAFDKTEKRAIVKQLANKYYAKYAVSAPKYKDDSLRDYLLDCKKNIRSYLENILNGKSDKTIIMCIGHRDPEADGAISPIDMAFLLSTLPSKDKDKIYIPVIHDGADEGTKDILEQCGVKPEDLILYGEIEDLVSKIAIAPEETKARLKLGLLDHNKPEKDELNAFKTAFIVDHHPRTNGTSNAEKEIIKNSESCTATLIARLYGVLKRKYNVQISRPVAFRLLCACLLDLDVAASSNRFGFKFKSSTATAKDVIQAKRLMKAAGISDVKALLSDLAEHNYRTKESNFKEWIWDNKYFSKNSTKFMIGQTKLTDIGQLAPNKLESIIDFMKEERTGKGLKASLWMFTSMDGDAYGTRAVICADDGTAQRIIESASSSREIRESIIRSVLIGPAIRVHRAKKEHLSDADIKTPIENIIHCLGIEDAKDKGVRLTKEILRILKDSQSKIEDPIIEHILTGRVEEILREQGLSFNMQEVMKAKKLQDGIWSIELPGAGSRKRDTYPFMKEAMVGRMIADDAENTFEPGGTLGAAMPFGTKLIQEERNAPGRSTAEWITLLKNLVSKLPKGTPATITNVAKISEGSLTPQDIYNAFANHFISYEEVGMVRERSVRRSRARWIAILKNLVTKLPEGTPATAANVASVSKRRLTAQDIRRAMTSHSITYEEVGMVRDTRGRKPGSVKHNIAPDAKRTFEPGGTLGAAMPFGTKLMQDTQHGYSPAKCLMAIRDNDRLMAKALYRKNAGLTVSDVVKSTEQNISDVRRSFKLLEELNILMRVNDSGHYRFNYQMLGATMDDVKTLINAVSDLSYDAGRSIEDKPLYEADIPSEKILTIAALAKMTIINEIDKNLSRVGDKKIWHIIESSVIPVSQRQGGFITQVNKVFRRPELQEKIWILEEGQTVSEAISEIRRESPDAVIDIALSSSRHIDNIPDDRSIKMLVFTGAADFVQLEGVIAALRALHYENPLPMLRRLYSVMTGFIYTRVPPAISDDPKEFARKFIFDLPRVTSVPTEDIPNINKRLLALLTAA